MRKSFPLTLLRPPPPPKPPAPPSGAPDLLARPGSATIRVTAADAKEAVERIEDGTDTSGPRPFIAPSAEASESVPIPLSDLDALEAEAEAETGSSSDDDDVPAFLSGPQRLATISSAPMATESLGSLTSGGYPSVGAPPADGMRLGAIVAVAGLFALVLGGLTAYLMLGGNDGAESPPAAASGESAPVVAEPPASVPGSDVGHVEVSAVEGAHVEIDGEDRGAVPVTIELPLGEHRVRVTAPGHHPWQTTIEVEPGANAAVKAELVEKDPEGETPAVSPPEATGAPSQPSKSRPRPKPAKKDPPKPKPKPKSDVFMNSSKGGDDGIFMPVGGK